MSEGSLIVVKKNGAEGSKFPMHKENVYKIGPGPDCNLRFHIDNYTENVCAISTIKKGPATISKLSSCPVMLNNAEIRTPKSLKYGDVIKIGTKIFKWGSLVRRESFTRNVFKNKTPNKMDIKSKRTSSGIGDRLSTWRETEENVQTTSHDAENVENIAVSNSPMELTSSETEHNVSSCKSKTLPRNHGSLNKTPSASVIKSLKFSSKSVDKKSTPIKKRYFDPKVSGIPSKIPRKFFPDKQTPCKVNTKPLVKKSEPKLRTSLNILEEFKENMKTPTQIMEKRKSTRSENKNAKLVKTPVALTEVNVRTPDSVGFKPGTPNIKLVKSVNKKSASLKKSLNNKNLAKKRKISNVDDDEFFSTKRFKMTIEGSEDTSLLQDESMASLFESSSSSNSPRRSVRKQNNSLSPNLCNISGIKSLIRSPVVKSFAKTRQSLQLKTPKNQLDVKRRFTENNLISFKTPESKVKVTRSTFSTPKAASSSIITLSVEQVSKKVGRTKTPKNHLTNVSEIQKLSRTPGRTPKSPKNDLTNIVGVRKLLRTPGQPPKPPKNDLTNIASVKKLLRSHGRTPKSPKNDLTNVAGVKKLLRTPGRSPKSPKNDLTNVAGVKKLLRTPGRPLKSPKNDLTNVAGVKKLLRTPGRSPKSPKNDLTNVAGVKKLLKTPGQPPKSPKNDLTDIRGVKTLLTTPARQHKSPKNDLTNVAGVKKLLKSPRTPPKSPKNDLTNVFGVKKLLGSPRRPQKSPKNDLTNVAGVKKILKSPRRPPKSPKNDLTDVSGVRNLLRSPGRLPKSPKNDLSNISGVENLLKSPGPRKSLRKNLINIVAVKTPTGSPSKSPKNVFTNVSGVEKLLRSPDSPLKSPKNYLTNVFDVNNLSSPEKSFKRNSVSIKTPLRSSGRTPKSPKNDLINVSAIKNVLRSPPSRHLKSPKYDHANIPEVDKLLTSPARPSKSLSPSKRFVNIVDASVVETSSSQKFKKSPGRPKENQVENNLSDVEGIDALFNSSKLHSPTNNMDAAFDLLKDGNNESFNLTFAINSKSPLRTYERKGNSLSPPKLQKLADNRKSLRTMSDSTNNKENVQKWLNEHVLNKQKSAENSQYKENLRNQVQEVEEVTRPRRGRKKVAENITPPKTRTRKVEEPEVTAPRTRRNVKTAEQVDEQSNKARTLRKRTKKDEENVDETASKRPRKQTDEVKQVHFQVSEAEETEVTKPVARTRRTKKVPETTETEIVEKKTTRSRRAKNNEEKTAEEKIAEEEEAEKKSTRGRKAKKSEEAEDQSVATRSRSGKKVEEPITKKSTRSKKNEEPAPVLETKKPAKRGGRQKKSEDIVETPEVTTRSTRGKKQKAVPLEEEPPVRRTRRNK